MRSKLVVLVSLGALIACGPPGTGGTGGGAAGGKAGGSGGSAGSGTGGGSTGGGTGGSTGGGSGGATGGGSAGGAAGGSAGGAAGGSAGGAAGGTAGGSAGGSAGGAAMNDAGCFSVATWPTNTRRIGVSQDLGGGDFVTTALVYRSASYPTDRYGIDAFNSATYPLTLVHDGGESLTYCQATACVYLDEACSPGTGCTGRSFLAQTGTTTISQVDFNETMGTMVGSGANLHMIEWDFGNDEAIDGGACWDIGAISFSVAWPVDAGSTSDAGSGTDGGVSISFFVVRVGDGTATLTSAATPVFLDGHSLDGGLVSTYPVPTGSNGLTLGGLSTSEGGLTLSTNGQYLVIAGYAADAGIASVATATGINRSVGRINASGTADTSTQLTAYAGSSIRGAASIDGTAFWTSGNSTGTSGAGVQYVTFGSTGASTRLSTGAGTAAPNNTRHVSIIAGNLYVSSMTGTFHGVSQVGDGGVPTTAGQVTTLLPGIAATAGYDPFAYVGFDTDTTAGMDLLYVTDTRSAGTGGGIQKWTLGGGGTWSLATTFTGGLADAGCYGVTGFRTGSTTTLIATTAENPQRVVRFDDDGSTPPTAVPLSTAANNTSYRGVALSPR